MNDNPSKFTHEVMKQIIVEIGMELEIDWLKAKIERLRAALRPFVEPCIEHCHETCESEEDRMEDCPCFKARAALEEKE